jgi:hypothetical protein
MTVSRKREGGTTKKSLVHSEGLGVYEHVVKTEILVNSCEMRFPRIVQGARKLRHFSDRCGEAIAE